ncbi:MAG: pilin [Patescibacteria group bacterium]
MRLEKLKKLISVGTIIVLSVFYFQAALAAGSYDFQKESGLDDIGKSAGFEIGANSTPVNTIISSVLYTLLSLVGIVFFAYLIYGAYTWMTSRGNEEKIKEATTTLINAIIGLIVTLSAYILTYFIVSKFGS